MKRSKTQAVYRFLPEMWISEKGDSERAVSARIKNWNYIKMDGSACLIIPEISCNHFNAELGRKYLYSIDGAGTPSIGFWEI